MNLTLSNHPPHKLGTKAPWVVSIRHFISLYD
jgi:hypothetical protein